MISPSWKEAIEYEIQDGTRLMSEAGRKSPALTKQIAYQLGEMARLKRKWAAGEGVQEDLLIYVEAARAFSDIRAHLWYIDFKAEHPDLAARWERMDTEDAS